MWNVVSSLIVLVVNEIIGVCANGFILYTIYHKQIGTQTVSPILTVMAIKNLIALLVLLPLAAIMISKPHLIIEETCYIQEIGTFTVLYASLLFPSVLSVDRLDVVIRPRRRFFNRTRISCTMLIASVVSVLLGFFPLVIHDDHHGCHLWSTRVDEAIWQYIYMLLICVSFSLLVMVYSYIQIYRYTKNHVNSLGKHQTIISGMAMPKHQGGKTVQFLYHNYIHQFIHDHTILFRSLTGRSGSSNNGGGYKPLPIK